MKDSSKQKQFSLWILGLALILTFSQCSKSLGPIDRDDLVVPDGETTLAIKTTNSNASESLNSYQLVIDGPSGTQTVSPTAETYLFTELENGTYNITSVKEGYLGQTIKFLVELPAESSTSYNAETALQLTKLTPPVIVDNETGGEVVAPPIGDTETGSGSEEATLVIPPGAIEEAGTTSVSFTQTPPFIIEGGLKSTDYGTHTIGFILAPYDIVLSQPVTVTMQLSFSPLFITRGITARLYLWDDANNVATTTFVDIVIAADGTEGTADIPSFGNWKVVESWGVVFEVSNDVSQTFSSVNCGDGVSVVDYKITGSYGPEYVDRMHFTASVTSIPVSMETPGIEFYRTSVPITFGTKKYTMSERANGVNGTQIEFKDAIPNGTTSIGISTVWCHDSGGK